MALFTRLSKPVLYTLFLFAACLSVHASRAADRQAQLQTLSSDLLSNIETYFEDRGWKPVVQGKPLIENSGTYDAITLPHLSFTNAQNQRLEMGLIAVNVLPGANPDEWKTTIALPTPIVMKDTAGNTALSISLGNQNFTGVYSATLHAFSQSSARYQNVGIDYTPLGLKAIIPDVSVQGHFSKGADNLWAGTLDFVGNRSHLQFIKTGSVFDIAQWRLTSYADHYTPGQAATHATGRDALPHTPLQMALKMPRGIFGEAPHTGMTFTANQNHMVIAASPTSPQQVIDIPALHMSSSLDEQGKGLEHMRQTMGYEGLKKSPATPNTDSMLPARMAFDLDAANLPLDKLAASLTAGKSDIVPLLARSNTALTIKDMSFGNDFYNIALNTVLHADTAAPHGIVGNGLLQLYGADNLANALGTAASNPRTSPEFVPYITQLQAALIMANLVGLPAKDTAGRPVKQFKLDMTQDGKTLVNGQDIQQLFGMMSKAK